MYIIISCVTQCVHFYGNWCLALQAVCVTAPFIKCHKMYKFIVYWATCRNLEVYGEAGKSGGWGGIMNASFTKYFGVNCDYFIIGERIIFILIIVHASISIWMNCIP